MINPFDIVAVVEPAREFLNECAEELANLREHCGWYEDERLLAHMLSILSDVGQTPIQAMIRTPMFQRLMDARDVVPLTSAGMAEFLIDPYDQMLAQARAQLDEREPLPFEPDQPFNFTIPVADTAWSWKAYKPLNLSGIYVAYGGYGPDDVHVDGVNMRGQVITSMGYRINSAAMDELALSWLRHRGLKWPEPPRGKGAFRVFIDAGDFEADSVEAAAREAWEWADNTSASNFSLVLFDPQGRKHEFNLQRIPLEDLYAGELEDDKT